ncbi:MAG: TonB-dependent receptor, partial [Bacteroidetes bacterium]
FSGLLRAGYSSKRHQLLLTHVTGYQQNQLAWLGASLDSIRVNPRVNANGAEDDQFLQNLSSLRHQWQIDSFSSFKTTLYYNRLQGNYDFDFNNFLGLPSSEEMYNYAFLSDMGGFTSQYRFARKRVTFAAGVQGYLYARRHTGSERSLGQLYQNTGYKQELAAWSQATYRMGKFILQADLQGRAVGFEYQGDSGPSFDPLRWNFLNPKAKLTFELNDDIRIYLNTGRTGREPTRNDMFAGNDDLPYDSLGRPALAFTDPEYVTQQELGFRILRNKLDISAAVYHLSFQNEIVLSGEFGPNGLVLNRNVARSTRSGVEISYFYSLNAYQKRLLFSGNVALSRNRIREGSAIFEPVLSPQLIANQNITLLWGNNEAWTAILHLRYQSRAWIDFANQHELPAMLVPDLEGSYTWKKFRFSLHFTNLSNRSWLSNGQLDVYGNPTYHVQAPLGVFGGIVVRS